MTITAHDQGMLEKGYRYRIVPTNNEIDPLYAKTIMMCGPTMREWPEYRFFVVDLEKAWIEEFSAEYFKRTELRIEDGGESDKADMIENYFGKYSPTDAVTREIDKYNLKDMIKNHHLSDRPAELMESTILSVRQKELAKFAVSYLMQNRNEAWETAEISPAIPDLAELDRLWHALNK